jgi:heme/copper-type cytochrome/quinol oxidase subunit 1
MEMAGNEGGVVNLEQKELWSKRLALAQAWCYFIGVLIFARGMISGGLAGMPRRTAFRPSIIACPRAGAWPVS